MSQAKRNKQARTEKRKTPKRSKPKENSATSIGFHLEEAIVHLHALYHYYGATFDETELHALAQSKRNLAVLHRRHGNVG